MAERGTPGPPRRCRGFSLGTPAVAVGRGRCWARGRCLLPWPWLAAVAGAGVGAVGRRRGRRRGLRPWPDLWAVAVVVATAVGCGRAPWP